MSQWFRLYESLLDDPKVQRLKPDAFKAWINMLALASRHDGVLPEVVDIGFALRVSEEKAAEWVTALVAAGLLDKQDGGHYVPHNWASRQYKSDGSADRMRRHRERHRNVTRDVTVTPSESEADTDTDSVAKATGADAPQADPVKALFDDGVKLLTECGTTESNARSIIAKWRKEQGNEAVSAALKAARAEAVTEPISWITMRFAGNAKPRETWDQRRIRLGMEAILR